MVKILVSGTKENLGEKTTEKSELGVSITVKQSINVSLARAADTPQTFDALEDDIVELEMEGGATLWLRVDELEERLGSEDRGRSAGDAKVIVLPTAIPQDDDARGIGEWVIKGLRVLGIDLPAEAAKTVALKLEEKATKDEPGLKQWDGESLTSMGRFAHGDKPWLLFLHGTASNTEGSFGDLQTLRPGIWRSLQATYEERILAFEHRSLTESPITNAVDIVNALPAGIELHLVSHSRGGLIGELLGRGRLVDREDKPRPPFDAADLALFGAPEY